jgi:hypothetical protein
MFEKNIGICHYPMLRVGEENHFATRSFKVEIWIIAKAFIKVLNLVVIACVMN